MWKKDKGKALNKIFLIKWSILIKVLHSFKVYVQSNHATGNYSMALYVLWEPYSPSMAEISRTT
jgi:hypothetical protein